ncbi:MAG TPA: methylated-DNA--[protein]-cysteine S-methyltransferase [Gemmatimonadota bacterium]|nr:methylated-DNA--[protein]-cysteine S-methyltransferase [Gemmatimonadota bacterium]
MKIVRDSQALEAMTGSDPQVEMVRHVCRLIDDSDGPAPTLARLAAEVGLSPHHLQRTFKAVLGVTPRQYAEARRLDRFKRQLENGASLTGAMYAAGYSSTSRLYERAGERLGMTPATYKKGGLGARMRYAIADSPLGRVLVAATGRGVCAVYLGADEEHLVSELKSEYPAAETQRDDSALGRWVGSILDYLGGRCKALDLPLDIVATAFQLRVWELLRSIPYGETCSYSEMAKLLGKPGAARAVGRACATNPVSLVIPCHRAIRADGELGGYRWGLDRKQRLLADEKARSGS